MTNEQAKSIAQVITNKLIRAGFVGDNRPARILKECAEKLEAIRQEAYREIKPLLAGGLTAESPFSFLIAGNNVRTWEQLHLRTARFRYNLNTILSK